MGPRGVAAQSTLRANWMCRGRAAEMGSRVQSNDELPGYPAVTESLSFCGTNIDCLRGDSRLDSPMSGLDRSGNGDASVRDAFCGSPK
jgi:hypothetical protein